MKTDLQKKIAFGAVLSAFVTAVLVSSCGLLEVAGGEGGSSSEVVAIAGSARNADGTAAAYATVRLRPADYLSGPPAAAKTYASIENVIADGKGAFRIDSITPGAYAMEIAGQQSDGAVREISVTLDSAEMKLEPVLLKLLSNISGTVRLPAGATGPVSVMVYGLERRVFADSAGVFSFNDMPEGGYTVRIYPSAATLGPCDVPKIVVPAGSTQTIDTVTLHTFADEDYSTWTSSRIVHINTSSSGANVASTIADFPLLVRFDAGNFDFSASLAFRPGTDVRFAGPTGKHLPCQIERWDDTLHKAEIWVRLDSVIGNDSAQSISMYCGKTSAASWTGGNNVFDTAAGFAAVWHFGDNLDDATVNGNTGTDVKTSVTEGLTGTCRYFDGTASFISINSSLSLNMSGKGPTILLWQRGTHSYAREGMYFEHDVWPRNGDYGFSTRTTTTLSFDYPAADSEVRYSGETLSDGTWHLVAASKDVQANRGIIYFNGDSVAGGPMRSAIGSSDGGSFIGSRGGQERFFEGYIDEMWVLSRPLSGSFFKLVYENQRPGQHLVSLR